jgi:H+/gluconate symporter-like permease
MINVNVAKYHTKFSVKLPAIVLLINAISRAVFPPLTNPVKIAIFMTFDTLDKVFYGFIDMENYNVYRISR